MMLTLTMDQEELDQMITDLLKRQGLKLSNVDNAIQWKTRPKLHVVVNAAPDLEAMTALQKQDASVTVNTHAPQPTPEADETEPLNAAMFPNGADVKLLAELEAREKEERAASKYNKIPKMPGESSERPADPPKVER